MEKNYAKYKDMLFSHVLYDNDDFYLAVNHCPDILGLRHSVRREDSDDDSQQEDDDDGGAKSRGEKGEKTEPMMRE